MKQTICIPMTFTAGTSSTTANVFIPFIVKKIHVKSAAFDAGTNSTTYVVLKSSWGLNAPLAIMYRDQTYSSPIVQDIEIELKHPELIQGNYTFTIFNLNGSVATATVNDDVVSLIVEFNGED